MASYFDVTSSACLALLPESIQTREDLLLLATESEAEIIQHYTRQEQDTRGTALGSRITTGLENLTTSDTDPVVYLRYYQEDADDLVSASELDFLTAMRRAIAYLIRIRAEQEDTDSLVKSETRGRRSVEYWRGADRISGTVPATATRWLKAYDRRPRTFAI